MKLLNIKNNFYKKILLVVLFLILIIPPFFNGGNNIYIKEIVFILVSVLGIFFIFFIPKEEKNSLNKKSIINYSFLFVFLIFTLISSVFSIFRYYSFIFWLNILNYEVLFFIISRVKFSQKEKDLLFKIVLIVSVILCLIGIYFYLTGSYIRLTSLFYWPNPFAGYLLFIIPLAVYNYFISKNKFLSILSLVILITSFLLTGSRGAFLILFIIIFIYLILNFKEFKKNFLYLFIILIFSSFLFYGCSYLKGSEFFSFIEHYKNTGSNQDYSTNIKLNYWQGALEIFKKYPIFGSGPDTFSIIYSQFQKNPISSGKYAHNWYLEILAESGVLSLLIWLIFLSSIIFFNWKHIKKDKLKYAIFIGILGSIFHNAIDVDWHYEYNYLLFWIFAGILINNSDEESIIKIEKNIKFIFKYAFASLCILLIAKGLIIIYSDYNYNQGEKFQENSDLLNANEYYNKSIKFNSNPGYIRQLGIIKYSIGLLEKNIEHKKEALIYANKSVNLDSQNSLNYELRGRINYALGDKISSINDFKKAIQLDKYNHPLYYLFLAQSQKDIGSCKEAKKNLEKIISYYPENIVNNKKMIIMDNQEITSGIENEIAPVKNYLEKINKECK